MDLKKAISEILYENDIPSLECNEGLLYLTVENKTPFRQIVIEDTKFHMDEMEFDAYDPDCFRKMIERIKFVSASDQLSIAP